MFITLLTILLSSAGATILSGGLATLAVQLLSCVSLGGVVFIYTVWRNYKKDTEEKEKACKKESDEKEGKVKDEIKHLNATIDAHARLHENAQRTREELVKSYEKDMQRVEKRLDDFNSVKEDVDTMKAEQRVQSQILKSIQDDIAKMEKNQDKQTDDIKEYIKMMFAKNA